MAVQGLTYGRGLACSVAVQGLSQHVHCRDYQPHHTYVLIHWQVSARIVGSNSAISSSSLVLGLTLSQRCLLILDGMQSTSSTTSIAGVAAGFSLSVSSVDVPNIL